MKAFLSHSHKDKEFVRAVAKDLGRQLCIFDEQSFSSGDEIKQSIEKYLEVSSVFVLFASQSALESIWVQFEMDEAWYQKLKGSFSKSLVYIIDDSVNIEQLPSWLKRSIIKKVVSPQIVARDIKSHIDELLRNRKSPYFVGRVKEQQELQDVLIPIDGKLPPRIIFITGLPGIGRRTIIKRVSESVLQLKKINEMRISDGDSLIDICINVANTIEPCSTKEMLNVIVDSIRNSSEQDAVKRIINNLKAINDEGELPIFLDDGGLIDNEGYIQKPIQSILRGILPSDAPYLLFVSSRKPQNLIEFNIPSLKIDSLSQEDISRLIAKLAVDNGVIIPSQNIKELAEYVSGYPPSAFYAVEQIKNYGLEITLRGKSSLVRFRTSVFLKHLSKLQLNDTSIDILRVLAFYSPLPINILIKTIGVSLEILDNSLINLIDLALVTITNDGYYRIADPVRDATENTFGFPPDGYHRIIAEALLHFIQDTSVEVRQLELHRTLYRAAHMAKTTAMLQSIIHFISDSLKVMVGLYHAKKYSEAIDYGYSIIDEKPEIFTARDYLIRALIQEERWHDAEVLIASLPQYAPQREVYFLSGFFERKQGHTQLAIDFYEDAKRFGRRGASINRELSYCYFLLGDFDKAFTYIEEALSKEGDNRYVVDLWAIIATAKRDKAAAFAALERLKLIDKPIYYHCRASKIAMAFGSIVDAQREAYEAINAYPKNEAPFDLLVQLAICEIKMGNTKKAEEVLGKISTKFNNKRRDVQNNIMCQLLIAKGRYGDALTTSERSDDKTTFYYKKIRQEALTGALAKSMLTDAIRIQYLKELEVLNAIFSQDSRLILFASTFEIEY